MRTIELPENIGTSLELSHAFTSIKVGGEKSEILLRSTNFRQDPE